MSEPIVRIAALRARDERGAVHGLDLALPAGPIGALIATPADGATALSRVLSGTARPVSGTVRVAGQDPGRSPSLRQRMGVLLDDATLPDVGRVVDLLALTRTLRGGEAPRTEWFEPMRLQPLAKRKVPSLTRQERRSVALGLALAVPAPVLLLLYDPLGDVLHGSTDWLRPLLRARAEAGACVLVITPSARDAAALADDVATLEAGRIGRAMGQPDAEELIVGSPVELLVWCDMARAFASALMLEPEIASLSWSGPGAPVRVHGRDIEACARAVARVALEQGVAVQAMQPVLPSAAEVNAATAGLVLAARHRAAYEAKLRESEGAG
ncbi:MAG: ATP-binding cassette domain-containing protein [Myxococcota bacterium]